MNKKRFDPKYLILLFVIIVYFILLMNSQYLVFIFTKPYFALFIPILILEVIIADILYKNYLPKEKCTSLANGIMLANLSSVLLVLFIDLIFDTLFFQNLILHVFVLSLILPLIIEPLIIFIFIERRDLINFFNLFRLSGILNISSYLFILIVSYLYLILGF